MNNDATLDATLTGLVVLEHPAAAEIDETWLEAPRWAGVVRVLRTHQARGGTLGDLIVAGDVLDKAGIAFPKTTAAEAALATLDAAPAPYVVARGRERAFRLRVHRLARILDTIARLGIEQMPLYLDDIANDLHALTAFLPFHTFLPAPLSEDFDDLITQNLSNSE
jgi:hypothetical protein